MALNTYIGQDSWIRIVGDKSPGAHSIPTSSFSEWEVKKHTFFCCRHSYIVRKAALKAFGEQQSDFPAHRQSLKVIYGIFWTVQSLGSRKREASKVGKRRG